MYHVHHIFPETGEWGCAQVDTLCEAVTWFNVKTSARNALKSVVTLKDPNGQTLKQKEM